ncbi:MAG: hypothetical protein OSA99_00575 [Acidimicrobiales bacterium]|nr:hypothetical protein [Acidimicrobiales bacterium]
MAARRRSKISGETPAEGPPILLIDAGLAAGWRRAEPDLGQLDEVVDAAKEVVPDVAVLGDASLKWSLPDDQQDKFEKYRATSTVLCAPGGTEGGHHAFLATAARAAAKRGRTVYVLSALALGEGPWRLAMLRRPEGRWSIELSD